MKTFYRYGLRRQLLLNLGLVVFVVWGLLSVVLTRTAYLRFMQHRVRYIKALSEQMEQIILLKSYGLTRNAGVRLWFGAKEFRRDSTLWPTRGLLMLKTGKIRPIFGVPPQQIRKRIAEWEKKNKHFYLQQSRTKEQIVWERYKRIFVQGQYIGILWMSWDVTAVRSEFFSYQGLLFVSLLLFGLLILFLSMSFLERRLMKPLDRLGDAMDSFSVGEQSQGLNKELRRRDEIGDLSRRFAEMKEILMRQANERERHIHELADANWALERAQDELVQREKMATVGFLSAGVAHEVGNPLSAIMGYSDLLKTSKNWGELEQDLAKRIHKEAQRIDRIIRDLLDYARPVERKHPGAPHVAMKEALEILRLQKDFKGMTVEQTFASELPLVQLAETHLVQVLINFLVNAADACGGKGHIHLSAEVEEERICMHIVDDGPGVSPEIRERIFEPFMTTKAPGKGIGLGLALCQRLVRESGGAIELIETEKGAHFKLCLPRVEPEVKEESMDASSDEMA